MYIIHYEKKVDCYNETVNNEIAMILPIIERDPDQRNNGGIVTSLISFCNSLADELCLVVCNIIDKRLLKSI